MDFPQELAGMSQAGHIYPAVPHVRQSTLNTNTSPMHPTVPHEPMPTACINTGSAAGAERSRGCTSSGPQRSWATSDDAVPYQVEITSSIQLSTLPVVPQKYSQVSPGGKGVLFQRLEGVATPDAPKCVEQRE